MLLTAFGNFLYTQHESARYNVIYILPDGVQWFYSVKIEKMHSKILIQVQEDIKCC